MFSILRFFGKKAIGLKDPLRDQLEIRLEAIGGQGANSAGKILAEAAVLGMGFSGQHFSSFGSEKRGSPVRSFVRFYRDRRAVRVSAPVIKPDILVIFHASLMFHNPDVLSGVNESTSLLVNSPKSPETILFLEGVGLKSVATVDASEIAERLGAGLNAVLLGAFTRLCPELDAERLKETLLSFFSRLPPEQRERIRRGFDEGRAKVRISEFKIKRAKIKPPEKKLPRLGWANAPIGGVITNPGNTALRDLSASRRGTVPALDHERCIQCGYCDMACPDFCFVWAFDPEKAAVPVLQGIDYQYCKGCQKCIEACPMEALTAMEDKEEFTRANRVPRFPGLGVIDEKSGEISSEG